MIIIFHFLIVLFVDYSNGWCTSLSGTSLQSLVGVGTYKALDVGSDFTLCMDECYNIGMNISAIWKNLYCFCTYSLDFHTNTSDTTPCITTDGFMIFPAAVGTFTTVFDVNRFTNITFASAIPVNYGSSMITVDPASSQYGLKYSYKDRSGIWELSSVSAQVQRIFFLPGIYQIRIQTVKSINKAKVMEFSTEVLVYQTLSNMNLSCQYQALVYVPVNCTVTLNTGSRLSGSLFVDGVIIETINLPDFQLDRIGSVPNYFSEEFVTGLSLSGINIIHSTFLYSGVISYVELNARTAATIDILLLKPSCGAYYCLSDGSCGTDPSCPRKLNCTNEYCPLSLSCSTNCNNRLLNKENVTAVQINYVIAQTMSYTITTTGYQLVNLTVPWNVDSGYRLGFHSTSIPDVIATTVIRPGESSNFYFNSHIITPGTVISSASFTPVSTVHQLSAVSLPNRNIKFKLMFNTTGLRNLTLNLKSIDNVMMVSSSMVLVGLKINDTNFSSSAYVTTNVSYSFVLFPHTGDLLQYYWSFGDNTTMNSTTKTVNHTFTAVGIYNTSVYVYNTLITNVQYFLITVKDPVSINFFNGTGLNNPNTNVGFILSMNSGTGFNCTLSGDGFTNVTKPSTNLTFFLQWSNDGYYNVRVECYNEISRDSRNLTQIIQSSITGLAFSPVSGIANEITTLMFTWTTGSNMTISVLVNNASYTATCNDSAKIGTSSNMTIPVIGIVIGVIRAFNLISDVILVGNLTFYQRISNTQIIANSLYVTNGSQVTYSVNMAAGSGVTALIDFADGTNTTFISSIYANWTNNYTVSHIFPNIGFYNVTVNCSNFVNYQISSVVVYSITSLGTYSIQNTSKFFKALDNIQLSLLRTSGYPAMFTNLTVNWQNGSITTISYTTFNESSVYNVQYNTNGAYNVTFTLQNPISTFITSILITIMNPITNLRCINSPVNTWNGNSMLLKTFIDTGDNVVLTLNPGDGSPIKTNTINATALNTEYDFNYTYNTVNNYTSLIWACNQLGCQNCSNYVQIQYKIVQSEFQVTTNGNIEYIKNNLLTTITFTGTNFPTSMTATFIFSDGSSPVNVSLASSMMPYVYTKNLSSSGFGNVTVVLWNLANSQNYSASYGAFIKFGFVNVSVLWGPNRLLGFGSQFNVFPFKNVLYIRSNPQSIGSITGATLTDTQSPSTILSNTTFPQGELSFNLIQMGKFNLTLKFYNPLDTIYLSVNLFIGSSIQNTEINSNPSILQPGIFGYIYVTWSVISTTSCICIDLADGTKLIYGATFGCSNCSGYNYTNVQPVNNKISILVRYLKQGDYNVVAFIYNNFESVTTNRTIAVSSVPCAAAQLGMVYPNYQNSFSPQTEMRSNQIILSAVISDIPCKVTSNNFKLWTAVMIDPSYLTIIQNIDLSSIPTRNNTQLIIPPRFLNYGTYKFYFTVTMDKNITIYTFQSSTFTYLKVDKSPIIVSLSSGGMTQMVKGVQEDICLTPLLFSQDPDLTVQNFTNWNWKWLCYQSNETPNANVTVFPKPRGYSYTLPKTGCFGDGPGVANFTTSPCFSGDNFNIGVMYTISLNGISPDSRTGISKINILSVNGIPPIITIQCLRPLMCKINQNGPFAFNEVLFNPSDSLLLSATCTANNVSYDKGVWSILVYNDSTLVWTSLNQTITNTYINGINSFQMSLISNFFNTFPNLNRFQMCYSSVGLIPDGIACIQFAIYPLPSGIMCTLNRNTSLQTDSVCVNCTYQANMQYRMYLNNSGTIVTLGFNNVGQLCSVIPYQPIPQTYYIRITNTNGGYIDVNAGNISITLLPLTSLNTILDNFIAGNDNSLQMAISKGDFKDMSQSYLTYMSLLSASNQLFTQSIFGTNNTNFQASMGGTGYTSTNVNPGAMTIDDLSADKRAIYESDRDKKSSLISTMASGLTTFVPADIKSLHMISAVLNSFGDSLDCINRLAQFQISNNLKNMADYFQSLQSTATKDDILAIGKNLLSAIYTSEIATNTQMDSGIKRDIKQSKDTYLDYDTNLESKAKSFMNVDPSTAEDSLVGETNSNFQGKVASGIGSNSIYAIKKVSKMIRDVLVVGDDPIVMLTGNMHYVASKQTGQNFTGKNLTSGRSKIELPDICKALNLSTNNCSNPNKPVVLEVVSTPNNIRNYLPNPNGNGLPGVKKGDYVTINLFTGSQKDEVNSKPNDSQNFTIYLSKDPSFKIQDFNFSEPEPKIEPPKVIPGTGTLFSGPATFEQKLVMYTFNLTGRDQSIHFEIKSNFSTNCTQYLIVGRLGKNPILGASPDGTVDSENFTFWGMIPRDTKYCNTPVENGQPDPFTFFISNNMFNQSKTAALQSLPDYSKTLNTIYFGVRELTSPEWNTYTPTNRPPVPYTISAQINNTFRVRIYSSGCYFYDSDLQNKWNTANCIVGPLTSPFKTQCICNHLTSFSSGWLVAPNSIDFTYIFSNFDFTKNQTLFVTEIVISIVFILLIIWARRQDLKDIKKIGLTPLESNDLNDMYLYELIVDTSVRKNAGTNSNVYFILSGEADETDPRHLVDSKRKILQRGNLDRFLLAVPRPLGILQYIRLWHDNSGKGTNASWYCNYFGVVDLQTKEKFHFLINNWFAVEESDGQIDRVISVAGAVELQHFEELFSRKMKTNLSEDHLWLSIVARPPESRFTRVERVACCFLLLFLTMLTTCMFYQTEGPSKTSNNILTIGPFALSAKELWTGFISNIIAFVPMFIIIDLFRRSALKSGYANQLKKVVEDHLQISLDPNTNKGYQASTTTLVRNEELNSTRSSTPASRSMNQINIQVIEDESEMTNDDLSEEKVKVARQKLLPWWTRIFVWIFLVLLAITAAVLTTFYGIQFGDMACKKWISSMFISFFTSILLVQPIKVICLAIFFALICKNSSSFNAEFVGEEEEIMNELGKRNALMRNEEYLHNELFTAPIKPHRTVIQPPSKEELEKARERRLKEVQMYDVLREISFYMIFFCTLLFVTYSLRDPYAYYLQSELSNVFIKSSVSTFTSITSESMFWDWLLNITVPRLRAPVWYNNNPQLYQRGFIGDRNNRLIGYAILRQVRTKKDSCKINDYVKTLIRHCYSTYNVFNQEEGNYAIRWRVPNATNPADPAFSFSTQSSLNAIPYIGRIGVYSGGGYVYQFRSSVDTIYKEVLALRDNHWIDFQTRAVFVEFTTYNPNINLFAINTYAVEIPGSGGMWPIYRVEPANLLGLYSGGVRAFEIFCQIMYAIFILIIIVKEIRNFMKQKWKYFTQFWNLIEIFIIIGSFAAVAGFVYVTIETNALTDKFSKYGGDVYLNFATVAFWNENLGYLVSFIVFASTLKFIHVLRFNKRIGMLGAVLSYTSKDLKQFFIIFAIMFLAFVMMFYSLFMDSLYRYHTFLFATEASMQIALGKFSFLELYQKEPILGPIVFASFVLFIIFILLNMFVALLYNGFTVVKEDIELQNGDHEIIKFMLQKFVMWTGINETKIGKKLIKTGITDNFYKEVDLRQLENKFDSFPEKVELLLHCINRIVYDGKKREYAKEKVVNSMLFDRSQFLEGNENRKENREFSSNVRIMSGRQSRGMTPLDK